MTPGEQQATWAQLREWVTWLHDRYELGIEERLPHCWAQHPGLIEELWALRAWREEIYDADEPSGQAARYWHAEMRQVIAAAATFYAAGCRAGHRGAGTAAAADTRLQQRWAAADPLAGIPPAALAAAREQAQPDTGGYLSQAAMDAALQHGDALPMSAAVTDFACYDGSWWTATDGGWLRVTGTAFAARIDACAAQLAEADTSAARCLAMRDSRRQHPGPDDVTSTDLTT